jgi:hypothetical protein
MRALIAQPVFPRPQSADDILLCDDEGPLSQLSIRDLLMSAEAEEWGHKVDATSPTRLLLSAGWVFKARRDRMSADIELVRARTRESALRTRKFGIWHPSKQWFVLHAEGCYWPANATPRLSTMVEMGKLKGHCVWVLRGLPLVVRALLVHRATLDPKPDNYGLDPSTGRLFYVDDEIYWCPTYRDFLGKKRKRLT